MRIFYVDDSVYRITSENWPRCCHSCFHQPFISSHGSGLLIDLPLDWVDCFGFIFRSEPAYIPSVNDHATMIAVNHTLIVMTSYSYGASIGAYALTYAHAIPKEINYMLAFFFYGTIHKIISMMYGPVTWEYITLIVYTQ